MVEQKGKDWRKAVKAVYDRYFPIGYADERKRHHDTIMKIIESVIHSAAAFASHHERKQMFRDVALTYQSDAYKGHDLKAFLEKLEEIVNERDVRLTKQAGQLANKEKN